MRLAARSADVELRAFADHDASRLAFVRTAPLHGPGLRHGGRVLGAGSVGESFHL